MQIFTRTCHYANLEQQSVTQTLKPQNDGIRSQKHGPLAAVVMLVKLCTLIAVCGQLLVLPGAVEGQIAYNRHLSQLRIQELHNLAIRLEHSLNPSKYACESYYDYVCSRNRPLFSVMGHLPDSNDLMQLLIELQNDSEKFEAKQKLMDFLGSCHVHKSTDDCYREGFDYFRPIYGHIITKKFIDSNSHEHQTLLELLDQFLKSAEQTENFARNPIRLKLIDLREKFRRPHLYFSASDLNREYRSLRIYQESYQHNLRNLQQFRKRNSTYEIGVQRTMLDWTLYLYQSRNKPMSYYFPTFNVHLWMSLYNTTERQRDAKYFADAAECLKLPHYVTVLEEARVMAVIYLKSFRHAWLDYRSWISSKPMNNEIFDQENQILKQYHLNNKGLFFTFYAQNFCEFGKELAENIFYVGLRQNDDFHSIYACGYRTENTPNCKLHR